MKKTLPLALALAFCLAGCGLQSGPMPTATPTPTPLPTPSAEVSPTPTEEPTELWGFPIDETHDAFEVDTKGRLGTVLVTVEIKGEEWEEFHFSVWAANDLEKPIQTMVAERANAFRWHGVMDANFDGYMDFTYQFFLGKNAGMSRLWLWDEEVGQFVEEPEYANISNPRVDHETQTISGVNTFTNAGDGIKTFHRWEDGRLVCFRQEEITYPDENWKQEKIIYERVNGELVEISREPIVMLG